MTLNCIIVDDNSTQRLDTLRLINNHPSLNLMGKFTSIVEAKKFLLTTSYRPYYNGGQPFCF